MDALPSARKNFMHRSVYTLILLISSASVKTDEDRLQRHGDRFGRRDDFGTSRRVFVFEPTNILLIRTFIQPIVRSLP